MRTEVRLITPAQANLSIPDAAANPNGVHLTDAGRKDAWQAGNRLLAEGVRIDMLHSSPLRPCVDTATTIYGVHWPGVQPRIVMPPHLNMTEMYLRSQEDINRAAPLVGTTAVSTSTALMAPQQTKLAEAAVLQGGARLASYLDSFRTLAKPPESVVAVTDAGSVNALLSLVEMGPREALRNPQEHLAQTLMRGALESASESLIVVEDSPMAPPFRIEYFNIAAWGE